jgi:hypothetical protein
LWQLAGEVFMLYIEYSKGLEFEKYLGSLPKSLQDDLFKIGFIALDEEQVMSICKLSDDLVQKAFSMI